MYVCLWMYLNVYFLFHWYNYWVIDLLIYWLPNTDRQDLLWLSGSVSFPTDTRLSHGYFFLSYYFFLMTNRKCEFTVWRFTRVHFIFGLRNCNRTRRVAYFNSYFFFSFLFSLLDLFYVNCFIYMHISELSRIFCLSKSREKPRERRNFWNYPFTLFFLPFWGMQIKSWINVRNISLWSIQKILRSSRCKRPAFFRT